jgi:hypothetical protein
VAYIPIRERLWCRPGEAAIFIGRGKTYLYEKIRSGEIVSRRDGRNRLIHVPSLIARYDLNEADVAQTEAGMGSNSGRSASAMNQQRGRSRVE